MIIVSPSLHTYEGKQTDAELLIEHMPELVGNPLTICIPLSTTASSYNGFGELLMSVLSKIPNKNDSTTSNIEFNVQEFIPNKSFFTYTDKSQHMDYILFSVWDARGISSASLETLRSIIKPYGTTVSDEKLYYNEGGANQVELGGGMYISCQPTGNSEDTTEVQYEKRATTYDYSISDFFNNIIVQSILIAIGVILVLVGVYYGYTHLLHNDATIKLTVGGGFKKLKKRT
jgi:hypothetical protein